MGMFNFCIFNLAENNYFSQILDSVCVPIQTW